MRRRGESGFVLIMVLVLVGLMAFAGLSVARLADTTGSVTVGLARAKSNSREIDGAMNLAISQLRKDADNAWTIPVTPPNTPVAPVKPCGTANYFDQIEGRYPVSPPTNLNPKFRITCTDRNATANPAVTDHRDLTVSVFDAGSSKEFGRASILLRDRVPGSIAVQPGFEILVCDWQIGEALASTSQSC